MFGIAPDAPVSMAEFYSGLHPTDRERTTDAFARRLLEMHEGTVCARSAGLGLGSIFEIGLPRIARPASAGAATLPFRPGSLTARRKRSPCVEAFRPDVGLLDIGLPEMNGYDLAKRLRAISRLSGMRLVALTGYGQAEDHERSRAAGFDDHLVKPVDLARLERVLASSTIASTDAAPRDLP